MGLLIDIKKMKENDKEALYFFSSSEGNTGEISINKTTGECFVIKEPQNDKKSALAIRVGTILVQHWRKGEFPDITCWAS